MATQISTGFENNSPLPLDSRRTQPNGNAWPNAAAINTTNYPLAYRKPGKTILVVDPNDATKVVEYWFQNINNVLTLIPKVTTTGVGGQWNETVTQLTTLKNVAIGNAPGGQYAGNKLFVLGPSAIISTLESTSNSTSLGISNNEASLTGHHAKANAGSYIGLKVNTATGITSLESIEDGGNNAGIQLQISQTEGIIVKHTNGAQYPKKGIRYSPSITEADYEDNVLIPKAYVDKKANELELAQVFTALPDGLNAVSSVNGDFATKVGIGTGPRTPTAQLEVDGDIKASNDIEVTDPIKGLILAIDGGGRARVTLARSESGEFTLSITEINQI